MGSKENKAVVVMLLVFSALLGGVGQFLFKYAFLDHQLSLTLAAGLLVYAVSTAVYFYVLSRVHLSWAYGLNGISYIVAVVFAATILAENVSALRWAGVLLIALGVVLVSVS
ncbi:MAG: hypothetical protein ACREBH_01335 [Candidatus Micrarchaeaceae archaeon]